MAFQITRELVSILNKELRCLISRSYVLRQTQASETCNVSSIHVHALCHTRSSLTPEFFRGQQLCNVCSWLDYCHSVFTGTSSSNIPRVCMTPFMAASILSHHTYVICIGHLMSPYSPANLFEDSYLIVTICIIFISASIWILFLTCVLSIKPSLLVRHQNCLPHLHHTHNMFRTDSQIIFP